MREKGLRWFSHVHGTRIDATHKRIDNLKVTGISTGRKT